MCSGLRWQTERMLRWLVAVECTEGTFYLQWELNIYEKNWFVYRQESLKHRNYHMYT